MAPGNLELFASSFCNMDCLWSSLTFQFLNGLAWRLPPSCPAGAGHEMRLFFKDFTGRRGVLHPRSALSPLIPKMPRLSLVHGFLMDHFLVESSDLNGFGKTLVCAWLPGRSKAGLTLRRSRRVLHLFFASYSGFCNSSGSSRMAPVPDQPGRLVLETETVCLRPEKPCSWGGQSRSPGKIG